MFVTVHAWEITDTGLRGRHDGYGCRRGRHGLRWPYAGREILQAENHEQIRELLQREILAKSQMQCFDIKGKITENKQMVQIGG